MLKGVGFYLNAVTDQINVKIASVLETYKNCDQAMETKLLEHLGNFIINLAQIYDMVLFLYKQNNLNDELKQVASIFYQFRNKSKSFELFRAKMAPRYRNYIDLVLVIYCLSLKSFCPDNAKNPSDRIEKSLEKAISTFKTAFQKHGGLNFDSLRMGTVNQFDNFFADHVFNHFKSHMTTLLFISKIQPLTTELNLTKCHKIIMMLNREIMPKAPAPVTDKPPVEPKNTNKDKAVESKQNKPKQANKQGPLDLLRKKPVKPQLIDKELNKPNKKVKKETNQPKKHPPSHKQFISMLNQNKHTSKKFHNINITPVKKPQEKADNQPKQKRVVTPPPKPKPKPKREAKSHPHHKVYLQNNLVNFRKLMYSDAYTPLHKRLQTHRIKLCKYREQLEKRKQERNLSLNSRTSKNSVLSENEIFKKTLLSKFNLLVKDFNDECLRRRAKKKVYFYSVQSSPKKCNNLHVNKYFNIVRGKPKTATKTRKPHTDQCKSKRQQNETCVHTGDSEKSSLDPGKEIFRNKILELYDTENPFVYEKEDLYPEILDYQHSNIF